MNFVAHVYYLAVQNDIIMSYSKNVRRVVSKVLIILLHFAHSSLGKAKDVYAMQAKI